jgi:hypothetical protein
MWTTLGQQFGIFVFNSTAIAVPSQGAHPAADAPKPRRSRAIVLTRVDRRTALGKRIAELTAIYVAALGGIDAISPIKRLKVADAAQLRALAELARGEHLRAGSGVLDDIVRIERKASAAEKALGIAEKPDKPPGPTLAEHIAQRAAARAGLATG